MRAIEVQNAAWMAGVTGQRRSNPNSKLSNNKDHSTNIVYNCTWKYDFLIECLHFLIKTKNQLTCKTTEVPNANNSNENRNKSCRDDDGTKAHGYSNQLPAKLNRWSNTGDGVPYHINSLIRNSYFRRNESRSIGKKHLRRRRINEEVRSNQRRVTITRKLRDSTMHLRRRRQVVSIEKLVTTNSYGSK